MLTTTKWKGVNLFSGIGGMIYGLRKYVHPLICNSRYQVEGDIIWRQMEQQTLPHIFSLQMTELLIGSFTETPDLVYAFLSNEYYLSHALVGEPLPLPDQGALVNAIKLCVRVASQQEIMNILLFCEGDLSLRSDYHVILRCFSLSGYTLRVTRVEIKADSPLLTSSNWITVLEARFDLELISLSATPEFRVASLYLQLGSYKKQTWAMMNDENLLLRCSMMRWDISPILAEEIWNLLSCSQLGSLRITPETELGYDVFHHELNLLKYFPSKAYISTSEGEETKEGTESYPFIQLDKTTKINPCLYEMYTGFPMNWTA